MFGRENVKAGNARLIIRLTISLCLLLSCTAQAGWFDDLLKSVGSSASETSATGSITNGDLTQAFKEALTIASGKVVGQLGQAGSFANDPSIYIPLPEKLAKAKSLLERVGMGATLSDLEVKLNSAAERATPQAKALFVGAIKQMSFDDIKQIYNGPADSATRYFESKMTPDLSLAMSPIVDQSLSEVGAIQRYDDLISSYKKIPLVPDLKTDLNQYVVAGALKGIFHYLAEQEAAIRQDPVKQTTALLRKVFGQ